MPTTTSSIQVNKKKKLFEEIESHKKEIVVTSVLLCTTIAGILIYKKIHPKELIEIKEAIPYTLSTRKGLISLEAKAPTISNTIDFPSEKTIIVSGHPRNLPLGHKASKKQLELAIKSDVTLGENQTYVTSYHRASA